mmetsp:Transcript_45524/g.105515  ORF Transcript_45524/g.105515 Transcript_45524/m.105515 type:complete len:1126 (-) Transcript_45524:16-3393(-)
MRRSSGKSSIGSAAFSQAESQDGDAESASSVASSSRSRLEDDSEAESSDHIGLSRTASSKGLAAELQAASQTREPHAEAYLPDAEELSKVLVQWDPSNAADETQAPLQPRALSERSDSEVRVIAVDLVKQVTSGSAEEDALHFFRSPSSLSDAEEEKWRQQGGHSTWSTGWSNVSRIQPGQQMDTWSDTASAASVVNGIDPYAMHNTPDVLQAADLVPELGKLNEADEDPQEDGGKQITAGEASLATLLGYEASGSQASESPAPLLQLSAAIVDGAVEAAKESFLGTEYESSVPTAPRIEKDDAASVVDSPEPLQLHERAYSRTSEVQAEERPADTEGSYLRSSRLALARAKMRTRAEEEEEDAVRELQRAMRTMVARLALLKSADEVLRTDFGASRQQGWLATSVATDVVAPQVVFSTEAVKSYQVEREQPPPPQLVLALSRDKASSPTIAGRNRCSSSSPKARKQLPTLAREDSQESSSSRKVMYSNCASMKEQRRARELEVSSPRAGGTDKLQQQRPKRPEEGAKRAVRGGLGGDSRQRQGQEDAPTSLRRTPASIKAPLTGRERPPARGSEGKSPPKQKIEVQRRFGKSRLEESAVLEVQCCFRMLQAQQILSRLHQEEDALQALDRLRAVQRYRQANTEPMTEEAALHSLTDDIVKGALRDAHHDLVLELRTQAHLVHRQTPSSDGDPNSWTVDVRKAHRPPAPEVSPISGASEGSRSPPASPRQSIRLCGRPNLRFFLTTTEERIAGGVFAGDFDVQPPPVQRSPRSSPGYRLTYHTSKQEARVAAEVFASGPNSAHEISRVDTASSDQAAHSHPSSRNSQRGRAIPVLPQSRPISSLAPLLSPRVQLGAPLEQSESVQAFEAIAGEQPDGERSCDEAVAPAKPSKPGSPRGSPRVVFRQDVHGWKLPLSHGRHKLTFPILDDTSEFARLKAFEEDFGRGDDHGDWIFALKSWVIAQANPQPILEKTRRPGSWSKQWVEQNTVPFRWSGSFAFVAHASEEPGRDMKAESSIISLPAVMGSEASMTGTPSAYGSGRRTSKDTEANAGGIESAHMTESVTGSATRHVTHFAQHSSPPPSARARKLLPAKLTMHRCGPLPAVRVLQDRRPLGVGSRAPDLDM